MIQRIGVLNISRLTMLALGEIEFVVVANALQQIPRPLETQLRVVVEEQIVLECATETVPEFDIRSWPARNDFVVFLDSQEQAGAEKRYQDRRLQLVFRILDESSDLSGRFAASPLHIRIACIPEVCRVELSDSIVGKRCTFTDGTCSGLVPDHSEREFELTAFRSITVVRKSHISPFMLEKDHI